MVIFPPIREAQASGINNLEGGVFVSRATLTTAGSKIATAPILFIKADIKPTPTIINTVIRAVLFPANRTTCRAIESATPLRVNPPLTMNTAHTVITAGLAKPENASSMLTKPVRTSATNTIMATTSTRSFSLTNRMTAPASMISTRMLSTLKLFIKYWVAFNFFDS